MTITDTAVEKAKEVLSAEGKADWGIRLYIAGSGCCGPSYGMDLSEKPEAGDEVYEKGGVKLFADKQTADALKDSTVDFIDDGQNQGFIIKGNNEPPSCSCGSGSCGS